MFERFTDRARTVVVMAQEEARGLGHPYIGTEHLLLGLLAEGNGVGAQVLNARGISLEVVRGDVVRIIGEVAGTPGASIPFTPRAKTVLESALRESLRFGNDSIGTEHILLGIVDEGAGVASQILASHGFSPDDARISVMREVGHPEHALAVGEWRSRSAPSPPWRRRQNTTPAVAEIYARARDLAADRPVSSAHMLRALVAGSDSQAARALASLGVGVERIEGALAATSTLGTTDETPEDAIARIASIGVHDDRVVIELTDAELARRLGVGMIELSGSLAAVLDQLHAGLRGEPPTGGEPPGASTNE